MYFKTLFLLALLVPWSLSAQEIITHDFRIVIQPKQSFFKVNDRISLPTHDNKALEFKFLLNKSLTIESPAGLVPDATVSPELTRIAESLSVPYAQYTLTLQEAQSTIELSYRGRLYHKLEAPEQESDRSFSQTPGLIAAEGIFLAKSTAWYPISSDELVSFSADIEVPTTWDIISQGKRVARTETKHHRQITWQESQPQDDIYLVGGQYTQYTQAAGAATAMVFLRQADDGLAHKYLDATSQYLNMYSQLIGPYPYAKFALVENFWETGYGMPSFTLLGPKVIRFPFIINSSYPHEILHNWWGNGVFVDYASGNWAEGLTAYLADHLVQEQRGEGVKYRRNILQKYTDYVSKGRDFPLTEFRSRHSSATEAVGYGKTLMLFHMFRMQMGDEKFVRALQRFYREFKFKQASFSDIGTIFNEIAEQDLSDYMQQWITRTGAPELRVSRAFTKPSKTGYHLSAVVEQFQSGDAYQLFVPIAIHLEGKDQAAQNIMLMNSKFLEISLNLPSRPLHLDIDPEFDLFRRLDNSEIPAALSQGFGAEKVLILLPKDADNPFLDAYHKLAKQWQTDQQGQWEIKFDNELDALPDDRVVWLLGKENHFVAAMKPAFETVRVALDDEQISINSDVYSWSKHAVVLSGRNPHNSAKTVILLSADNTAAIPGLGRKLPHYRNYSYLVFEGDEPVNIAKGQWPVLKSPMTIAVKQIDGSQVEGKTTKLKPREPLAELTPVFSESRMLADINYLADEKRQGRGLGSPQLDAAAQYIATAFKEAGLQAGGDSDSFLQTWSQDVGPPLGTIKLHNVIGVLPGNNAKYAGESVVVSAHYDHLGTGWPDVHAGDENKIHPGADDNASGVAVMLEFARLVAKKWHPERSIVFIAFTGEETNVIGSSYYVNHNQNFPTNKIIGVINLDTVGRLNENPLTILGTGSASEWIHIFRGAGFVTGINVTSVANDFGTSDQKSFLAAGVPAVQLFGTAHSDFHRPGDTISKIDSAGLVKTASILKEAVEYLANREQPLTVTLSTADKSKAGASAAKTSGRRVSVGTVPDFTFAGQGVRISDVIPDSPAAKAGLKQGDILIAMQDKAISDLAAYSNILKTMQPGDSAALTYLRDGKKYQVVVTVTER